MASGDRTRYYWDRQLECLIEIRDGMNSQGPQKLTAPTNLVRDIENYNAVGIRDDAKGPGHTLVITKGRRQHRDELKARGMIEVGNERSAYADKPKMPDAAPMVREAMARAGVFDGARSLRDLKRQGRL